MYRFAEKDRTAADKTATTLDDLTETSDRLNQIIHTVDVRIQAIRVEENTRCALPILSAAYKAFALLIKTPEVTDKSPSSLLCREVYTD